jgi:endonuclease/exonuclease/phosphatase family metal-dependent hydrolase
MKGLPLIDKIVFTLNILFAFLLFLASLVTYISVAYFPYLFVFSLAAPFAVALNVLFCLYWLFRRRKHFWLSFSVLFIGYFIQDPFIRIFDSNSVISQDDISILTFNALSFNGFDKYNPEIGEEIVTFITAHDPDIVCFQEFDYTHTFEHSFKHYSYSFVNYGNDPDQGSAQAIFSKYPIIDRGSLDFYDSLNNAIFADVVIRKDTLRVYNVHLQSLRVRPYNFKREQPQKLFKRLGYSFVKQQQQVDLIRAHASQTGYKKIICGDFNNTQFSNVYRELKGDMQDSFEKKGFGYGRTYNFKFLPFRIDFILADPTFEITAHKNFDVRLSDHFPVMASIRL